MLYRPGAHYREMRILLTTPWRPVRGLLRARLHAAWSGTVVIALCLACAKPAGAKLFSYTQIAYNTPQSIDRFYPEPAINGSGSVAFYAIHSDSPVHNIYVGNGGGPATLIASSGGPLGTLYLPGELSISDPGDVVFQTQEGAEQQHRRAIVRYDAGGTFTTIASADLDDDPVVGVTQPSVNNVGAVAFLGLEPTAPTTSSPRFIMFGAGGPTGFSADADGLGFDTVGAPSVRREGPSYEVAFAAREPDRSAVYKVSGLTVTPIVHTDSSDFVNVASEDVSISDAGWVAFVGERASGVQGIYVGNGTSVATYADSTGAYDSFGAVANSTIGAAFEAQRDIEGGGVYAGSDPVTDRVIEVGDSLPGFPSKVTSVSIGHEGYNNAGQVAMIVRFEDGTERIIRADPLAQLTEYDPLYNLSLAFLSKYETIVHQTVPTPAGVSVLGLDYLFMTTEGVLDVLVNGVNVASVPAPGAIADDFRRLEIPIDPRILFPDLPGELSIAIRLNAEGTETGLLVDNVEFPGLVDGDFQTGTLEHWQTEVTDGGAVGLALAPPGVIPEPATMALLGLAAFGLGGYVRKRRRV